MLALFSLALAAPVLWRNTTKEGVKYTSVCDYLNSYLPDFCECSDVDLGAVAKCQVNVMDVDSVGVKAQFEPCAQPLTIGLEITEADAGIDYPIAGISAGDDKEIPVPGLSFGLPVIGSADANMAVKVDGNIDAVNIAIGVDACATVLGFKKCGSSLTSELPIWILNGQFDFSNLCAVRTSERTTGGLVEQAHGASNGEECCSEQCSSNSDCAAGLFCCPHHNECMDTSTKSTRGPNCDACSPPSPPVELHAEEPVVKVCVEK